MGSNYFTPVVFSFDWKVCCFFVGSVSSPIVGVLKNPYYRTVVLGRVCQSQNSIKTILTNTNKGNSDGN